MDGAFFYFYAMDITTLHQHFIRSSGVCTDSRTIFEGCLFFALKGPSFNGNSYAAEALDKGASFAVIDEEAYEVPGRTLLVDDVLQSLQDLARHHRNNSKARILALTGSNGKTTTKELLREVLSRKYNVVATKGNLNNHIGVPLTLLNLKEDTEIGIIEMGANHQGEIASLCEIAEPEMGLITNFGKAHLEGFGGVEGVIKGKSELYTYLTKRKQPVFLNADDAVQLEKLRSYTKKIGYSQHDPQFFRVQFVEADPHVILESEGHRIRTQLTGSYNFQNCAIALTVGKYLNVPMADIKHAIEHYLPSNNRSQWITMGTFRILMDAYNANPTSMSLALENFSQLEAQPKYAILGDMFELGDVATQEHQIIADLADSLPLQQTFLVGKNFYKTKSTALRFEDFPELKNYLKSQPLEEGTLLIKGSRGMKLERVLEVLPAQNLG